ncbi:MAG TPA: hypothetical protein VFL57_18270 [Bryobacteraceae bacterium]|nr:hypothetical protein [Bryobacteraceae bacterium]
MTDDLIRRKLSTEEMRNNVIRLAFYGDPALFQRFCAIVRDAVPEANTGVLRGSAVTGFRWKDGVPFDADGPGTSDLDLTLVGSNVLRYYTIDGYWIPGIHSRPLSEEDPDIAPELVPLRRQLMDMVHRPVNIQGTRDWIQYFRGEILGQPYFTLFGSVSES